MMNPRMSMITLGVSDLQKSIDFYSNGLNFPKMDSPPEVAFFTLNGTWLALYPKHLLAEDANVPNDGTGFSGFTISHNVDSDSKVDEIIEQAIKAGAKLIKPGQKVFWGGYSGYFSDPDGFLWEIANNPYFWVGPRDT